ncbi:HK97 family phage prohead protease [Mycobacterium sp. MBM]|nr:HK97 family phage prohead protease [Mycobacterium sp. MBM]
MTWRFFGYACVFGQPDREGDVFAHHCFHDFLDKPGYLDIPMLAEHLPEQVVGRWLRMVETGHGLLVWGEFAGDRERLEIPNAHPIGLSIGPTDWVMRESYNVLGGRVIQSLGIREISLVNEPLQPGARIIGEWTELGD